MLIVNFFTVREAFTEKKAKKIRCPNFFVGGGVSRGFTNVPIFFCEGYPNIVRLVIVNISWEQSKDVTIFMIESYCIALEFTMCCESVMHTKVNPNKEAFDFVPNKCICNF